jgi:hypothetical protein
MHSNNSFDVFDTLLARRQIFPKLLFNDVERETGVVGFSQVRIDAEKKLSKYNYNIDDIYNVLGANFDPATTRKLREAEFGIESRSLFPIVENLSRVTEGDILVSDTYLPADFIREILHRFGATPNFTLYTSANGKKNGWMWCHLSGTYQIQQHHGDNVLSDYIQPMKFSIPAQLCTFSQPLPEKHLLFPETIDLIRSVRQARLQNPHTDYYDRQVWTFACTSLFPILISICLWLRQIQKEGNFQNVLFCSRDAFYLYKIFHAIADDVSSGYLLTSRESRLQSHQSYLDYLDGMIAGKSTLVVDLIGTGLTLTKLRDRLRNGGSFRIAIPFLIKQTKITRYRRLYSQSHRDDGIYYIGYMDDYNVQGGLFEEVAAPPQAHFVNTIHRFGNEIGKLFSKENQEGQRKRQIISGAIDECIKVFIDKPFFLSPQVTTNCLRSCFDVMNL